MTLSGILTYPLAALQLALAKRREREMGYAISYPDLSPHWINTHMIFDMSPVWRRYGLHAKGVNYFTIGAVRKGLSTRFDANSRYYQAWLGGYIVRFPEPREWTLADHFELGVADQKNWLILYGDKEPRVAVQKSSVKPRGRITVSGRKGKLYEGNIWSDTDVGDGRPPWFLPAMLQGGTAYYNRTYPGLHLSAGNFLPVWKDDNEPLAPYQKILLKGYIGIVPLDANTTALLYANGCEFTDRNGKKADTFAKIAKELRTRMEQVRIQSVE